MFWQGKRFYPGGVINRTLGSEAVSGAVFVPARLTVVTPPWNFPVAIPLGGVLAALAAGAAVIGAAHPKWDERPVLFVVRKEGSALSSGDLRDYLADKVAKWWLPDAVEFVDDIPHTATGKISKKDLRERFSDYVLET